MPLPQQDQESVVFEDALTGPNLGEGWQWIREDAGSWSFSDEGLKFLSKPGGLWEQAFAALPPPSLLALTLGNANACEVNVTMPSTPGPRGEQAGIFWHVDDNNYVKLVVEWEENGSAAVILARERNGEAKVFARVELDSEEPHETQRLRLERSADGSTLSGVIVGAYYMRLVGSCSADLGVDATPVLAVSAHGGPQDGVAAGRAALIAKFKAISVKANRVQWAGGASAAAMVQPDVTPVDASASGYAPAGNQAEASGLSGWTLAPGMSEEEMAKITALLAGATDAPSMDADIQMQPAPIDGGDDANGLTLSPSLSEEERSKVIDLLKGAQGAPAQC